jgi:maltose alpha-D-glucosyltransferase / alpha-amylase
VTSTCPIDPRLLRPFLERQRWFAGKAKTLFDVRLADWAPLDADGRTWLAILEAIYGDGGSERYAAALERDARSGAIADALQHDEACRTLLAAALTGRTIPMHDGAVRAPDARDPASADLDGLAVRRGSPDQSNTCIVFGDRYILKLMRRLDPGPNLEVEIGRRLAAIHFAHVAPLAGALEYAPHDAEAAALVVVQGFVKNDGTAWDAALADVVEDLRHGRPAGAAYRPRARRLGERTGQLHVALARPTSDPAFSPEPFAGADLAARMRLIAAEAGRALALLESKLGMLSPAMLAEAKRLLDGRAALLARLDAVADRPIRAARTRVHGDYHLGQVLATGDDFLIIDFEGEPSRTLQERRAKASPLKDVAGMLRSFGYAAQVGLDRIAGADAGLRERLREAARGWETSAAAFLDGYRAAVAQGGFVSAGDDFDALLGAFVIEKAFYELAYELGSRPEWVHIPLQALVRLLA